MTANTDILQFESINTILNTLYEHGDSYEFSHPQFKDKTGFYRYAFPTTFTDYPNREKELKQLQCKSIYDVLNRLYENAGIDKLSEAAIEQNLQYDYLHVQIALPPAPEFKSHFKYQWHHYIIITCFDDDAGDDIRILHTTENLYQYLVALTKAVLIDHKNPAPENTPI
nr:hypothetical protein [Cytophagales bacterium]